MVLISFNRSSAIYKPNYNRYCFHYYIYYYFYYCFHCCFPPPYTFYTNLAATAYINLAITAYTNLAATAYINLTMICYCLPYGKAAKL